MDIYIKFGTENIFVYVCFPSACQGFHKRGLLVCKVLWLILYLLFTTPDDWSFDANNGRENKQENLCFTRLKVNKNLIDFHKPSN